MIADIVELLRCTHCGQPVEVHGGGVRCELGHSFDIAREGYLNMLPGDASASTADTAEMVAARRTFLSAGHFEPIARGLVRAVASAGMGSVDGVILDVGAGTGYYLDALLGAMPKRLGVALDISKRAARVAARANPRASAIVADVWDRMPLRDSCAAVVTCVFAPRNADEFARVLAPAGVLVVVTPDPDHLAGIAEPLGLLAVDPRKSERLSEKLAGHFRLVSEDRVDGSMQLARAEALAAAEMGPAAAHSSHDALQTRAAQLPEPATVRLSVTVRTFRPVARWTARPECAT